MAGVDDIVTAIQSVKTKYEQAQQELAAVASDTETTANNLNALGAEKTAELLGLVKDDLETIAASSAAITQSLETAAGAAEASKG